MNDIYLQLRVDCCRGTNSSKITASSARTLSGSKAKLTCAKFSSVDMSGKHPLWLAVGTDDGCIHTFRFKERQVGWLCPKQGEKHEELLQSHG